MEKLIAKRPIQYMGRTYERGEAIPAQDSQMVAAWLKAGSAAWVGVTHAAVDVAAAVRETARRSRVNDMAAEAIRAMGVIVEDDTGEFVGTASIEGQLRAIFAGGPGSPQNDGRGEEGQEPAEGETPGQNGQETPEEAGNSGGGGTSAMLVGHLDAEVLSTWRKQDLEKLAADMGVDISKAKNNTERAAILAAVEIQAPAGEDSSVPPELDAGASEV